MAKNQFNRDFDEVKRDGMALQYVKEQSPEICMEAVRQNGMALQFVEEQTAEICMAAVQQRGYALKYVKEQDPEICKAAVRQNSNALKYVQSQFRDEVWEASKEVNRWDAAIEEALEAAEIPEPELGMEM